MSGIAEQIAYVSPMLSQVKLKDSNRRALSIALNHGELDVGVNMRHAQHFHRMTGCHPRVELPTRNHQDSPQTDKCSPRPTTPDNKSTF